jgi:uncharacterized protein YbjT (DUF2867 family)
MKRVLAAGSTGYLGRYIVSELKKRDYMVYALARGARKLKDLEDQIDEIIEAEVTMPETLAGICRNIDVVISSIGITRQKDGLTYMDVDYQGNMNLLEEAEKAGVSKFIYVSVINAHLMKDLKGIQAKEKFVEELKASGIDYSVIRPTGFFSDMLEFKKMAEKGKVFLFGDGENKINPIHGGDLAEVCVDAIDSQEKETNAGGPEIFTYREIAELAFRITGKKSRIFTIPSWLKRIIIKLLKFFTSSRTYGPVEFMMTVMTMDVVGDLYGSRKLEEFYRIE